MKLSLIIADFESSYSTSFQHTARKKYGVDFASSNVDTLVTQLSILRQKVERNEALEVHVGLEITLEHVEHVQSLLNQILDRYKSEFGSLPINRKIYTINQKLREVETPAPKELAKQVLNEILSPSPEEKQSKKERIQSDADALSKQRALKVLKKNQKSK
jgi:hypothetical protein